MKYLITILMAVVCGVCLASTATICDMCGKTCEANCWHPNIEATVGKDIDHNGYIGHGEWQLKSIDDVCFDCRQRVFNFLFNVIGSTEVVGNIELPATGYKKWRTK